MLIELSYKLHEEIPTYPGLPREKFDPHSRMANGDQANTTLISAGPKTPYFATADIGWGQVSSCALPADSQKS